VPILVEADDDGLYVLKLRGAAQGPLALVAELVAGEIARALELLVPEIVLVNFDPEVARDEVDAELQDLFRASGGLNLGFDYLPGAAPFHPGRSSPPSPELAARIVVFDALVDNVDRHAQSSNLLVWHRRHYLIDHGATLSFHFRREEMPDTVDAPSARIEEHVLLPFAADLHSVATMLRRLDGQRLEAIVGSIPDAWLTQRGAVTAREQRASYMAYFRRRLGSLRPEFLEHAERARARLVPG